MQAKDSLSYLTMSRMRNINEELSASYVLPYSPIPNCSVLPQQTSPLKQPNSSQPSSASSRNCLPKGVSFTSAADGGSTLMVMAKADLKSVTKKIFSSCQQKPVFMDTGREKNPTSFGIKSLPTGSAEASVCKSDLTPPVKRQKINLAEEGRPKVDQRNRLPTVVDMHSPVRQDEETTVNHTSSTQLIAPKSLDLQNSVCLTSSAKPIFSLPLPGVTDNTSQQIGSPQGDRCTSLPNIALMMNRQNVVISGDQLRPSQTPTAASLATAGVSEVSGLQPHMMSDPLSKSSPFSAQVTHMLTVPLFSNVSQFLTTQALPGVPIIPVADLTQYQSSPSPLMGQQAIPTDKKVTVSPVHQKETSAQVHFTGQEAVKIAPEKEYSPAQIDDNVRSSHSSHCEKVCLTSVAASHLPEVQTSNREPQHGMAGDFSGVKLNTQATNAAGDKRSDEPMEYKTDDHLRPTQNDDLQAASAILMLSNMPVVSSPEILPKTEHSTRPVNADPAVDFEQKAECHSVDSDYHSMPCSSLTDSLYQVNKSPFDQKDIPPVTLAPLTQLNTPSSLRSALSQPTSGIACSTQTALPTLMSFTSLMSPFPSPDIRLANSGGLRSSIPSSAIPSTSTVLASTIKSPSYVDSAIKISSSTMTSISGPNHCNVVSPSITPTTTVMSPSTHSIHEVVSSGTASGNTKMFSDMAVAGSHTSSQHTSVEQRKEKQLPVDPPTQNSSEESVSMTSKGEPLCDSPLSLVIPHQETTRMEHQSSEFPIEESGDPVHETMCRILEKLERVEKLHRARQFRDRDLSLLLLVLGRCSLLWIIQMLFLTLLHYLYLPLFCCVCVCMCVCVCVCVCVTHNTYW